MKIKKLHFKVFRRIAEEPQYKTAGSVGADVCAAENVILPPGTTRTIKLGIGVQVPEGYEVQIRPRSGLTTEGIIVHLGTIDEDYRGEICAIVTNATAEPYEVLWGQRIAQMVVAPVQKVSFIKKINLTPTKRGAGGFGSTGK